MGQGTGPLDNTIDTAEMEMIPKYAKAKLKATP
jgi:hypothetical protein